MLNRKHAPVVVACLFAGVGAWGAKVTVANGGNIYASELFGAGHAAIKYPDGKTPNVVLTIPANRSVTAVTGKCAAYEVNHDGSAEITFVVHGGTFASNVTGLMYDRDGPERQGTGAGATSVLCAGPAGAVSDVANDLGCVAGVAAPASVASIMSGGRAGDNFVTIKVAEAVARADAAIGTTSARPSTATGTVLTNACDADPALPAVSGTADAAGSPGAQDHTISFDLPRLTALDGSLAGANATDDDADNDEKTVWLRADSRIVSGTFTDGPLSGSAPHHVVSAVKARDSLTVSMTDDNMKTIAIDDNASKGLTAFMSVKEKNKDGYVELATVEIVTRHIMTKAKAAVDRMSVGYLQRTAGTDKLTLETGETVAANRDQEIYQPKKAATPAVPYTIYDLDGASIDAGLRGTLTVSAVGTRDLFNDGDVLFIDYDKNGKMGGGEEIAGSGDMKLGSALSVDPDKSDSFDDAGTGTFKVYYMPGGKMNINHGSMIKLTAMVDYSDPTAIDEPDRKATTTLNFDGVGNPVMAYAIPHSTNSIGDKGNVRVRCEASSDCRVFLECWDDMGMRGFGEAPMVAGNSLVVWSGADVEGVTGLVPTSRHSCRVLSKGMVTVQQLTRDGNSGTLVNNTYVGGGM